MFFSCRNISGFNTRPFFSSNAKIQSGVSPKRKEKAVPVDIAIYVCQVQGVLNPCLIRSRCVLCLVVPCAKTTRLRPGRCVLLSPLLEPFRQPSWTGWPGMPMRLRCGGRRFCWQAELPTAWRFVSGRSVALGGKTWE